MADAWKDGDLGDDHRPEDRPVDSRSCTCAAILSAPTRAGYAELGGGFYESQQGQKFRTGPRGGFNKVGGPTDTALAKAGEVGKGVNNALALLDQFDKGMRQVKTGPLGWLANGNDLAAVSGLANQLLLNLKEEPYNLGVLNGPDEVILRKVITNPESLRDAVFRDSVIPRLQNIAAELGRRYRTTRGGFAASAGTPRRRSRNLFQAADSQYTPRPVGREGLVPPNIYKGQRDRTCPTRPRPRWASWRTPPGPCCRTSSRPAASRSGWPPGRSRR
jgi:hypothetical protein